MDSWERFEETKLSWKNAFYSMLNMKGIGNEIMDMHGKFGMP